jgi:PAS domain-containing protein
VAAFHLDHGRGGAFRHGALGVRRNHPVFRRYQIPAGLRPPCGVTNGAAEGFEAPRDLRVRHELGTLTFLDLTHEDYRESNWRLVTELFEGKRRQFQIEKKYRCKDGSLIWVSNNVSLVPGTKSMPRFVMALSEDVTERKQTEERLRQSQAELEKAFEEIKRLKDRLQDENLILREEIDQAFMFDDIVGSSPVLQSVLSSIVKVAPTDTTIFISGETGPVKN